jgi:aldehyde:ferredoxin oxidoreductase
MDKGDIQKGMDMFYQELDWDCSSGLPKRDAYKKVGLSDVAAELAKKGLLP